MDGDFGMIVTIRKKQYTLGKEDFCIYNGSCYILVTQTAFKGYGRYPITFPKTLMARLLREGKAYKTNEKYESRIFGSRMYFPIYKFREVESE